MTGLFEFEPGLIIWQIIILLFAFFILGKYAWKPILSFIQKQEQAYALAEQAFEEQQESIRILESESKDILKRAKKKKSDILEEALVTKKELLEQAQIEATQIKEAMILQAQKDILKEKEATIKELKKQIGLLTIQIAEKLLQRELSEKNKQDLLLQTLITQANTSILHKTS